MLHLNHVIISGRLTQEPEIREVGQVKKKKLAKFGIAYNRDLYTAGGKKKETLFVDIQVWEQQANFVEKYMKKGDCCLVEGSLVMEQWRTKMGEMKSKLAICANKVNKLYTKKDEEGGDESPEVEESAPPATGGHRYSREDCNPDGVAPAKQTPPAQEDEAMYDDSVVPF